MRKDMAKEITHEMARAIASLVRTYKEIDQRLQARVDEAGLKQKKSIMEQIKDLENRAEALEDPEVYRTIKADLRNIDDGDGMNYFIPESGIRKMKVDK